MRAKEAEAAKQRALDAKKKEQHRQLAAKLHEELIQCVKRKHLVSDYNFNY